MGKKTNGPRIITDLYAKNPRPLSVTKISLKRDHKTKCKSQNSKISRKERKTLLALAKIS